MAVIREQQMRLLQREQNEEETASYMKEQDLEYEKIYRILA